MKYLKSLYAYVLIWQQNRLIYFRTLNFAGAKTKFSLRFFYSYFWDTILVRKKWDKKAWEGEKKINQKGELFYEEKLYLLVGRHHTGLFSSDDSAEYGYNVNIKTTDYLFRVVQVGRARNIAGGGRAGEIIQINKSISGTESCKTVPRWRSKVSQLQDIEIKWDEDAIICRVDILVTAWNFTTLQWFVMAMA